MVTQQKIQCHNIRSLFVDEIVDAVELLEGDIMKEVELSQIQQTQIKLIVDKLLIDVYTAHSTMEKIEAKTNLN